MRYTNAPKIDISPDDLPEKFRELVWIGYNIRKYKKIWEEHYGAANRNNLRVWENKLDMFLEKTLKEIPGNDGHGDRKPD